MIVSISRDGKHVADLHIDDMRDWAEVCNALRERMFPDTKLDTSKPDVVTKELFVTPKRRKRKA